ncbi:hypothetical protein G7046_g4305 [Stylonectria norvegica]|nr:hypothetical protein G7046_g4305 [Stylonectria norvegica]
MDGSQWSANDDSDELQRLEAYSTSLDVCRATLTGARSEQNVDKYGWGLLALVDSVLVGLLVVMLVVSVVLRERDAFACERGQTPHTQPPSDTSSSYLYHPSLSNVRGPTAALQSVTVQPEPNSLVCYTPFLSLEPHSHWSKRGPIFTFALVLQNPPPAILGGGREPRASSLELGNGTATTTATATATRTRRKLSESGCYRVVSKAPAQDATMYRSSKSKSKSRWSEWIWHEEYQRYYRQRSTANGELDYEWHDGATAAAAVDEQTPRDTTAIDDLTQGIANLDTSTSSAPYDPTTAEYSVTSGATGSRSKSKPKSSSRGKGKQRAYPDEDEVVREPAASSSSSRQIPAKIATDVQGQYYDPNSGQYYSYPGQGASRHRQTSGGTASFYPASYPERSSEKGHGSKITAPYYPIEEPRREEDDDVLQAAMSASRNHDYPGHSTGEASGAYEAYDFEDEGPPTPKAGQHHSAAHIAAADTEGELLDPRYRVEHSDRFQPGEIFKVLWSEPQGSGNEGASVSERREFRDRFGGKFFVGFRRFIIIANDLGHCTCVPILTYGGKGCKKRGVKPAKHGIVYERGSKAMLLKDEPKLGFAPVQVEMTMEGEKLSKESRVNYSKLVTVEHNVKVFFIGNVAATHWDIVSDAVNHCWEDKIHHKRRHFK